MAGSAHFHATLKGRSETDWKGGPTPSAADHSALLREGNPEGLKSSGAR